MLVVINVLDKGWTWRVTSQWSMSRSGNVEGVTPYELRSGLLFSTLLLSKSLALIRSKSYFSLSSAKSIMIPPYSVQRHQLPKPVVYLSSVSPEAPQNY